jgi:hypothetical protein
MFEVKPGQAVVAPGVRGGMVAVVILGLLALIFGGVGVGISVPSFRARGWPTVQGTILSSTIHTQRGSKGGSTYACRVSYTFQVNGARYEGRKLDALEVHSSGRGAHEDQATFAPGKPCQVHYNPDDPSESCLRPGPGVLQYVFLTLGAVLCGGMVLAMAAAWWKRGQPGVM